MATFVLLHGIPGSAATWEHVAARLRDHHTVVAPDLLGFGGNTAITPPVEHGCAESLLAPNQARHVLRSLDDAGLERAVFVGHDFGGPVAAHVVAEAPERVQALALLATNIFPDTPIPFPLSAINAPILGAAAARILFSRASLAMMLRQGVGRPSISLDPARYIGNRHQQAAIAAIFGTSLRKLRQLYTPVERALRAADLPALVGWGQRDPFFSVATGERTAAALRDATFRLYPGAGHFLPEERPDEITADLLELAALASAR